MRIARCVGSIDVSWAAGIAVSCALLTGCGGGGGSSTSPSPQATQLTCAQLAGMSVPVASIGLPTTGAVVATAVTVAASGAGPSAVGEFCLVTGAIMPVDRTAPNINFQLGLPTTWNTKMLMLGGGGDDGSIPVVNGNLLNGPVDQLVPLGRGYATFGSDSGHQANALGSEDGSFGLNDESYRNYAGDALKKTRDTALFLVKARYGVTGPSKSYFAGGSTGGRESLTVIQRWPEDWDGAISLYPAWAGASISLSGLRIARALAQPGAYLDTAKRGVLFNAAMATCDALDGVVDGLISNVQACNAAFDPATALLNGVPVRCPGGVDTGDTCLSDAQIAALNTMNTAANFDFLLASGETQYPGYNVWGADLGIPSASPLEPIVTFLAMGFSQPAFPMPTTAPYGSVFADQWIRYSVTRNPNFDSLTLDPENPGPWGSRISELSAFVDASKTDLSAFSAKGGKLLLAHGMADVLVSTRSTEQYYQRLQATMGADNVDTFVRFYEIPGLGHAFSTQFNAAWDQLTALENWVEQGTAPTAQIATDTVGVPGRTRPLCGYPSWPKYSGTGDVNLASSFICATQ